METLSKHARLQRRGSRYFLRAKVPDDIRQVVGKREIIKALETSVYAVAVDRLRVASCEVDAIFAEARRRLKTPILGNGSIRRVADDGVQPSANAIPITALTDVELRRIVLNGFAAWERRSAEGLLVSPPSDADRERALAVLAEDEATVSGPLTDDGTAQDVQHHANRLLAEHDIEVDPASRQYRLVLQLTQRALIESIRREQARYSGSYNDRAFDRIFSGITAASPPDEQASITLGALIEKFKADPSRADRRDITAASYEFTFKMLREVIGESTLARRITRADCRKVRDLLTALPPNSTKRFPKLSLLEAADHAKAHGLAPLNVQTQQTHMSHMAVLFKYAFAEDYTESNPADGLTVASGAPKKTARRPYTLAQLQAIFAAPLFTGCQDDERGYAMSGAARPRRGRFWVPLLSLFGGLRLNEACQLLVADVRALDGVDCIAVTEDGDAEKRVKTAAGQRIVPVHPELKRIGFLEFVTAQREAGASRLFPELPRGSHGYASDPFQKWWARFTVSAGAAAPRTSFHSLRHNFRDGFRDTDVPTDRVRALGGWARGNGAEEGYGAGFRPSTLAAEMAKLRYDGLDLSHLVLKPVATKSN
jgi:integrase